MKLTSSIKFFALLLFPTLAFSQGKFLVEASSGVASGWWIYNRGSTDPDLFNNQGWDRTQHSFFLSFKFSLFYKINRFKIGVGAYRSLFLEDTMLAFEDSDDTFSRYGISNGSVQLSMFSLQTEFDLVQSGNYTLGPKVGFGFFEIDTTHPQKGNFGQQTFWEVGLTNEIRFSRFALVLRPQYEALIILPKEARFAHEKHTIYDFGLDIGIRYWLK
ncbi:MAG: hypothetical protein ACE5G1_00415 [bacterium]